MQYLPGIGQRCFLFFFFYKNAVSLRQTREQTMMVTVGMEVMAKGYDPFCSELA